MPLIFWPRNLQNQLALPVTHHKPCMFWTCVSFLLDGRDASLTALFVLTKERHMLYRVLEEVCQLVLAVAVVLLTYLAILLARRHSRDWRAYGLSARIIEGINGTPSMIRAHAKAGKTGAFHGNSCECGSHENAGLNALKTVANLQLVLTTLPPS